MAKDFEKSLNPNHKPQTINNKPQISLAKFEYAVMWEYLVILTMIVGGILIFDIRQKSGVEDRLRSSCPLMAKWRDALFWLTILCLAVMAGLRYRNGLDTIQYQRQYYEAGLINNLGIHKGEGRLYPLMELLRMMGVELWGVQMICALFLNGMTGYFVSRYTSRRFTALLLYVVMAYLNFNFEVMRESFAIGISLWAWKDFRHCRWLRYYLKALPAIYIHFSGLILLLLPLLKLGWINKLFTNWKRLALLISIVILLGLFMQLYVTPMAYYGVDDATGVKLKLYRFINDYAGLIGAPTLNLKGYIGLFIKYVGYVLLVIYLLKSRLKGEEKSEWSREHPLSKDAFLALLSRVLLFLYVTSFCLLTMLRYSNWLIIPFIVAIARMYPLPELKVKDMKDGILRRIKVLIDRVPTGLKWWLVYSPMILLYVWGYKSPVTYTPGSHAYELYIPYTNWIERQPNMRVVELYRGFSMNEDSGELPANYVKDIDKYTQEEFPD